MAEVTFFFDPLCPWTWRASSWIREVQRQQDLVVHWRFFSLALSNNMEDPFLAAPLRIAALVGREGGDEGVGAVYKAIGTAIHDQGQDARQPGALERLLPAALTAGGLDPALLDRAMADPTTLAAVSEDTAEAKARYGAYGVPWLVMPGREFGYNGPIMTSVPQGEEALGLWQHLSWMIDRPYFYELKRDRT